MSECRVGSGFDVHPFARGRPLRIGGVTIDHDRGLEGESDADVLLHALADALLGATASGDLGVHFPPGDPRCKGLDSAVIVAKTCEIVAAKGFRIVNVDATVIAQEPRLSPHFEAMRRRVAGLLGIALDRVSVKAKTTDHLGFLGRAEGVGALVTVLVEGPGAGQSSSDGSV